MATRLRSKGDPGGTLSGTGSGPPWGKAGASSLESTRTLILRVRSGDADARNALFARFLPALRRWAHGRLPSPARSLVETDDLVQVSLTRAFARLEEFEPRRQGAFLAYLHQILLNCIREEIRRASRRPGSEPLPDALPEDRPSLLERTIGEAALEAYEVSLAKLSEEQQQAVILRLEFGLSHQEIAELLGKASANAARMQITRGLLRLAELMDAHRP